MAGLDIHLHDLVESQVPSLAGREQGELTDYARQLLLTRFPMTKRPYDRSIQERIKKHLLARPTPAASSASSPHASTSTLTPTDRALRFTNLARRLPDPLISSTSASGAESEGGLQRIDEVLELLLLLAPSGSSGSSSLQPAKPFFGLSSAPAPQLERAPPLMEPPRPSVGLPDHPSRSRNHTGPPASAAVKGKGRAISKAKLLEEWNSSTGKKPLPAETLLRESLYLLQGISGVHISFATAPAAQPNPYLLPPHHFPSAGLAAGASPHLSSASFEVDGPIDDVEEAGQLIFHDLAEGGTVSGPVRGLLRGLGETGWLVRNVETFVREVQDAASTGGGAGDKAAGGSDVRRGGLVEQSLCHFLQTQLTEYYHLISILETQMASSSGDAKDDSDGVGIDGFEPGEGLTLMRLGVWTREARLKMRLMSLMVDDCRSSSGGQLVSRIHAYTENGDPFARSFTDSVLEEVSKPFFYSLSQWIYHGDLHDPFAEFFVLPNPSLVHTSYLAASSTLLGAEDLGFGGGREGEGEGRGEGGVKSWELWRRKWEFKDEMRPSFVSEEFARKIFSTGKSLNFIRYSCQDSDWIATRAKLENAGKVLKYSDIAGLERSIDAAYEIASKRLLEIFFDKFEFMYHLRALKMYLLLGHGDFVDSLMGSLAPDLSKPANQLYRHTLTATLESSIRSSNAAFDPPAVRRRLDARMLPYAHGESGWDCFVLDYKVDAPVDTVLDPRTMEAYQRMFVHLWKLKRVESALSGSWMRLVGGGNSRGSSRANSLADWHQARVVHAEMLHFIRQLQAFYQLEVIECSWQAFEELIAKNEDGLDGLVKAHREYLGRLMTRILLVSTSRTGGTEDALLRKVQEVFQVILDFRTATETLYRHTLEEEVRNDSQRDSQRGVFTQSTLPSLKKNVAELIRVRAQIKDLSAAFQNGVNGIVASAAAHPDPEVKLLAIRCSYNAFYNLRPPKERRKERSEKH